MSLRLLNGAIATSSAPALATDGFSLQGDTPGSGQFYWLKRLNYAALIAKGAGTGALTFQGIIWVYSKIADVWAPLGIGAVADRGKLNDGTTITGTTTFAHAQRVTGLSAFERIALQVTTLTGTDLAVSAYLVPEDVEG